MKIEVQNYPNMDFELVLNYCGFEECDAYFVMNPHIRSEYLFHYITEGSGTFICENVSYEVSKGDIFVIMPNKLVSYQTCPTNPLQFSWFSFSGKKSDYVISKLGFSDQCLVRKLHPKYSFVDLVKKCSELLNSIIPYNDFMIQSLLYSMLSNLSEAYASSANYEKEERNAIHEHIEKATAYINFHYMYPISVNEVAQHVGLERSYFSKIFHKYTGNTAQKYILKERIRNSARLLEKTSYTIKEISSYVGIQDEFYFSRAFKLETGMSPRQYRHSKLPH